MEFSKTLGKKEEKKLKTLEKLDEHELLLIVLSKVFGVINFREFGQNSETSQKFLLAKVILLK